MLVTPLEPLSARIGRCTTGGSLCDLGYVGLPLAPSHTDVRLHVIHFDTGKIIVTPWQKYW